MDDILPSYESVINQNPWELIGPYLPINDLLSATLVCRKWHEIFTPRLWGDPGAHFAVEDDFIYIALTRFMNTLSQARAQVRELTHTLRLPRIHTELYGGPQSEWLRDCLERLPCLQSLIVKGLPFFDHASLLTLRYPSLWWKSSHSGSSSVHGLRLLDASECINATSTGISEALSHFPDLVSLDLSKTGAAKDEAVFTKLKFLRCLRVLKLAGIGLKDYHFAIIASSIGTRVRSLDISGNNLTDRTSRVFLEHCIEDTTSTNHSSGEPQHTEENSEALREADLLETVDLDRHVHRKLTQAFIGTLAIETARAAGITHLYISNNAMTARGISALLRPGQLRVLDVGTLSKPEPRSHNVHDLALPGVETLTPILNDYASRRLRYLRIDHSIVTKDVPLAVPLPRSGSGGEFDVHALEAGVTHIDSSKTGAHELPGNDTQPIEFPVISSTEDLSLGSDTLQDQVENVEPESERLYTRRRQNSTSYIHERRARLNLRQSQERRLHPGMLPKMDTLVLTNVPTKTKNPELIHRLIQFITDCAEEFTIATIRAKHTYKLPPGRNRTVAEREYVQSLFALRRIVLEMAPPEPTPQKFSTSWRQYPTKSSTEDRDSEAFWEAATHDFSFFGNEDCMVPDEKEGQHMVAEEQTVTSQNAAQEESVDVIAEIARFRSERKTAYRDKVRRGDSETIVDGYWPGDITVVRM